MFGPLISRVIRIGAVLDAQIVQQELRWRLRRRQKQSARISLHEAICAGIIIPVAPTFLIEEIEDHAVRIAQETGATFEDVQREWQDFLKLLHFYSPQNQPELKAFVEAVDKDDLPYVAVAQELGMPIYSQDHHYEKMQAPVIGVLIDATARSYARSSSVQIAVMVGSAYTVTIGVEAISAACRVIKNAVEWFGELHPGVQVATIGGVLVALAHPTSRAKLASVWDWVKKNATPPVMQAVASIAVQLAEASKNAEAASKRIHEAVPSQRKRTALMHARMVCLLAKTPVSLAEIESRMRADGYVTRARDFASYLRRVMRSNEQFTEVSRDVWALSC
jgi:hypothetical protein